MKHSTGVFAMALPLAVISASTRVGATPIGNVTFTAAELFKSVSVFDKSNMPGGPPGSNTVIVLHGKLIVMGSNDSGKPPGTFHVFDISDPRKPVLLNSYSGPETSQNRELHAMPFSLIDGKIVLVCPTTKGIQFYDFTDLMKPSGLGSLALPGVSGGDYTNVAWELSWSWPYVFVGSSGSGVDIVDARDPMKPTLVKQIPTGQLGGFRVGPVHAAGNYLTVASMDQSPTKVSIVDVSDPMAPFILAQGQGNSMYSSLTIGDLIFGAGVGGNYSFLKWTTTSVTTVAEKKLGSDKGGYCTYQDGFGFCGESSDGFHKVDLRTYDDASIKEVGNGKTVGVAGDFDFATVLGNMVYNGNDHGTGAGLIPHQMEPDSTPPKVFKIFPEDKAVKQPVSTRLTIFFTDELDTDTVNTSTIIVRKNDGTPVPGVFSRSSFNAISFGSKQPLSADSTYEVVVKANGVKDLAGNAIGEQTISSFSTGAAVGPGFDGGDGTGAGGSEGTGGSSGDTGGSSGGTGGSSGDTGGGSPGDGGSSGTVGTGGSVGTAGIGNSAGGAKPPSGDAAGCACAMPGRAPSGGFLSLLLAALGIGAGQARARRRQRARIGA
jgi:hypothetical protein